MRMVARACHLDKTRYWISSFGQPEDRDHRPYTRRKSRRSFRETNKNYLTSLTNKSGNFDYLTSIITQTSDMLKWTHVRLMTDSRRSGLENSDSGCSSSMVEHKSDNVKSRCIILWLMILLFTGRLFESSIQTDGGHIVYRVRPWYTIQKGNGSRPRRCVCTQCACSSKIIRLAKSHFR